MKKAYIFPFLILVVFFAEKANAAIVIESPSSFSIVVDETGYGELLGWSVVTHDPIPSGDGKVCLISNIDAGVDSSAAVEFGAPWAWQYGFDSDNSVGTWYLILGDGPDFLTSCTDKATAEADPLYVETLPFEVSTTSLPIVLGGATSTVEQAQSNLSTAFVLFLSSMFGMIWLMRKH